MPSSLTLTLALTLSAGADWPQWRGPNRDGAVPAAGAPTAWPEGALKRGWKVPVGEGHAGPVVVGDRVFVFARADDNEVVRALSLADGKELWKFAYPAPYEMNAAALGHGKGPKATPCVAGGRVYTLGISGVLTCLDAATGAKAWQYDAGKRFKTTSPLYGAATSPIVSDGLCLVWLGGHDDGALVAFDAAAGREKWAQPLDGPGYASPVLADLGGRRQLVTQSQQFVVGLDPATGRPLWKQKFSTPYDQNSVTPVVANGLVVTSGYNRPVTASRVGPADGAAPEKVWDNAKVSFYMSTPVAVAGRLAGLAERGGGTLVLLDPATGKTVWQGDGRTGEYAALVAAGDFLLVQTTGGELRVFRASADRLDTVAEYKVADGPTWAHPAVAGDAILVKDKTHIYRWDRQ